MPALAARRTLRKRFALLVTGAALLWLLVMLVVGDSGALALWRARAKLERLEQDARVLAAENARLVESNRRLDRDDLAIERIAREQLMMGRSDEEVILVPDPKELADQNRNPTATPSDARLR
jgi:cell division protein FtsB